MSNTEFDKVSYPRVPTTNIGKPIQKKHRITLQVHNNTTSRLSKNLSLRNAIWRRGDDINPQLRYNQRSRQLAQAMKSTKAIVSVEHHNNYRVTAAKSLLLQQSLDKRIAHVYNAHGDKQSLDKLLNKNPTRWLAALSNEWGCLSNGNDTGVKSTNTLEYIFHHEVPTDKKVTYASYVCDHRPLKDKKWQIRLIVGGNKLHYNHDVGSPTTDIVETKIIFNSTISDAHAGV